MKHKMAPIFTVVLIAGLAATSNAAAKGKDMKSMPKEEQIKLAQSAAPPSISNDATIMVIGEDGKMVEAKKGTNGFTCLPDIDGQEVPDPICADQAAMQWANDLMSGTPKPTNTVPGVAYMAKGGWHWEKDGKIIMDKNEKGAKRLKEPPHWMILWAFDSKASGLPSNHHSKFGTYVMFDGTPYAHLMIYQNPNNLK